MSSAYILLAADDTPEGVPAIAHHAPLLRAQGWTSALQRERLGLWVFGARPPAVRVCHGDGAILIGATHPAIPGRTAPQPSVRTAVGARAAELCRRMWGAYVAVLQEPGGGDLWAFREPSGAVEAYTWRRGHLRVLASGLAGVTSKLHPDRMGLDWDVIADFIRRPAAVVGRSGLSSLTAIAPGDLHRLGDDAASAVAVWRPLDFVAPDEDTVAMARARLADVVASAVQSMVAPYGRVLTECSGGLDSSIVNACLAARGEGGRVATVLHYVGDRPDSDERAWAAQLCDRWGLPLSLATREVGRFDPEADFAELARDIRPPLSALDGWRDRDVSAQVRRHGAEAVLTGMGGDAAFFQMPSAQVLSDLWQARGLGGLQDPAWREVPRWLRRSAWSTAHEAVGALRRPGRAAQHPFAGPRVREPTTAPAHPWLVGVEAAPPGKRLQIAALTALQLTLGRNRRSAAADMLHPLLSQPVMETCLSIPSWVLVRGGRDRGLAREAFAELLPPALVSRRSKGSLTSLYSRRAAASLDVLRPYLLDGVLADAGVLDRAAMEVALDPDHLIWRADGLQLISATAIEAWARHWQTRVADAPHAARRRS